MIHAAGLWLLGCFALLMGVPAMPWVAHCFYWQNAESLYRKPKLSVLGFMPERWWQRLMFGLYCHFSWWLDFGMDCFFRKG